MNVCIHVHEHIYNRKEDFCFTLLSPIVYPMEERFLFETRTHIFPHTLMTLTPTHWVTDLHYIDIYSLLCGGWALNPSTQIFRESLFIYWAKLPQNTFWDRISSLKLDVTGCLGWGGGERERVLQTQLSLPLSARWTAHPHVYLACRSWRFELGYSCLCAERFVG